MRYTRRDVLRVGLAALGLSLPQLLAGQARAAARPRARSAIILYLSGGPSQLDMWDLKPDAPEEIRGAFRPIRTSVTDIQIGEHLPRMARLAHRYAIVRSMSHGDTNHVTATYWAMTGHRLARSVVQASGMDRGDRPHLGAVVARTLAPRNQMPPFVTVPEFVSPVGVARPGQHAGFLGVRCDPYLINSDPNTPEYDPGPLGQPAGVSDQQLEGRKSLLHALEGQSVLGKQGSSLQEFDGYRAKAFDLVASSQARLAFDLNQESDRTRDRYGRHTFGQSVLVGRRLIEAGVRLVQVNFVRHDNGKGGQGYDSHREHLPWLKDELLPPTDAAFASLIEDLSDRGLLDETLVLMFGEFGRTPRFNANAGRDHWSRCYSLVVAGGGFAAGQVYGASDATAAAVTRDPVSVEDLHATVYHLLGIDHHAQLRDVQDQPHTILEGRPVRGLMSDA